MPDAPAPTPVLSITSTSGVSPAADCSFARCHALDSPWMPAPITRYLTDEGSDMCSDLLSLPLGQRRFSNGPVDCSPAPRTAHRPAAAAAAAPPPASCGRTPGPAPARQGWPPVA